MKYIKLIVNVKVLDIVEKWLGDVDMGLSCGLQGEEVIWVVQQLSKLDAMGLVEPSMKKDYENKFLQELYNVCVSAHVNQVHLLFLI